MKESFDAVIRADIATTFRGVHLGDGVSLKQAQAIDNFSEGLTEKEFDDLQKLDVTSDWTCIPEEDIAAFEYTAYLDAGGFYYYIPALMLSLLNKYEPASMRVIGTLQALYPEKKAWAYHMERYKFLTFEQKRVIAKFLQALPQLTNLRKEDLVIVGRALRNYWREFLPTARVGRISEA